METLADAQYEMNTGMTPRNPPLWFPLRGPLGSFPHSLEPSKKTGNLVLLAS